MSRGMSVDLKRDLVHNIIIGHALKASLLNYLRRFYEAEGHGQVGWKPRPVTGELHFSEGDLNMIPPGEVFSQETCETGGR